MFACCGAGQQAGYGAGYGAAPGAGGESSTIVVEVPNDKVGLVIGKAGSTIKELEGRSGARVQITPDSIWQGKAEPRPIQLSGTQQQLDWCKASPEYPALQKLLRCRVDETGA